MSFSTSISGHFDNTDADSATSKEAALVSDLKELVARYPEISSASFSGQFGYLSLLPAPEEAPAADVPDDGDKNPGIEEDEDSGVAEDVQETEED